MPWEVQITGHIWIRTCSGQQPGIRPGLSEAVELSTYHDLLNHPYPPQKILMNLLVRLPLVRLDKRLKSILSKHYSFTAALKLLNNGKVPSICSITVEQLKYGGDSLVEWLVHIIKHVCMLGWSTGWLMHKGIILTSMERQRLTSWTVAITEALCCFPY